MVISSLKVKLWDQFCNLTIYDNITFDLSPILILQNRYQISEQDYEHR